MRKKTKWRVKGKWCRLILFFFLWSELFFLWSEFIRVQFYFIFIFLFDPSWFELILPGLAVRVDPVRLLYLPIAREVSTIAEEDRHRHFLFIVYYQHLRLVFWSWMLNILGACWSRYFYVESEFTVASLCSRGDSLCFRKQYHRRQDGGWMLSRPNLADAHISWAACRKKVSSIIFLDQVFYR